jgi:hypothetical protein
MLKFGVFLVLLSISTYICYNKGGKHKFSSSIKSKSNNMQNQNSVIKVQCVDLWNQNKVGDYLTTTDGKKQLTPTYDNLADLFQYLKTSASDLVRTGHIGHSGHSWENTGKYAGAVNNSSGRYFTNEFAEAICSYLAEFSITPESLYQWAKAQHRVNQRFPGKAEFISFDQWYNQK